MILVGFGIWDLGFGNTEYGTRSTEHGIRSTEYGIRNNYTSMDPAKPSLRLGTKTTWMLTLHISRQVFIRGQLVSQVLSVQAVDQLLATYGNVNVEQDLLRKIRKAMYKTSCSQKVGDVLTKHMSKWS